jgi:hypothetical protein
MEPVKKISVVVAEELTLVVRGWPRFVNDPKYVVVGPVWRRGKRLSPDLVQAP